MNALRLIIKLPLLLIIVFIFNYHPGCKDPHKYEPGNDSLVPPPSAPVLLYPRNDTMLLYDQWHPYPNDIELGWSYIEEAEYYELQVSHNSSFPSVGTYEYRPYDYSYAYEITHNGKYYWRVRAYSPNWTWFTDWSETWSFTAAYNP